MKSKIQQKLDQYGYDYQATDTSLRVKLGFAQKISIHFSKKGKCMISDKLVSWNFLTGTISMSLNKAMLYNTILYFIATFLLVYLSMLNTSFNVAIFLIGGGIVTLSWTIYYVVKLENFKRQVMTWSDTP